MAKKKGGGGNPDAGGAAPIRGAKMKAAHIVVKKLGQAQEIRDQLAGGADFGQLAAQHSDCPSKKRGGNLGEFHKGMFHDEFWNACAALRVGQISEPVRSPSGYHIIKRLA
jgi:foldase protein PrsA